MANPSVAIILINWNGYDYTRVCLASLSELVYDNFQAIVVDNGSTDDSLQRLKHEFSKVDFIANEVNLGFAGGNNVGIKRAMKDGHVYITLLNNDTKVEPNFLNLLVGQLEANRKLGAVQPQIRWMHMPENVWNGGGDYNQWTGQPKSLFQNENAAEVVFDIKTKWLTGCCVCLPSAVIQEVGLLDEAFFAYYEDVDWSFRIAQKGYTLGVVPEAIIYHVAGASSNAIKSGKEGRLSPQVHFLNTRNQIWIIQKYLFGAKRLSALLFSVARSLAILLYFVLKGRRNKSRAVLLGLKEAFQV
jgi:hypothetical protein